jgi:hypothetical protein
VRRNAYLGVAAAAALVLLNVVEFRPPERVRLDPDDMAALVGEAPRQEFTEQLENPQAVQVRATLRQYSDPAIDASQPDPEVDQYARVLSQPVVTTILGMNATIDQTVRLDAGDLEVDLLVHATPRLQGKARKGKPPPLSLEHDVQVVSRKHGWFTKSPTRRTHVRSEGLLLGVEERGYRLVFTVDDHLFALDLELYRSV